MNPLHRSSSWCDLIAQSLDKLTEAENDLRRAVLFEWDSDVDHALIEADAFIRRAISTLKNTLEFRKK